MRDDPHLTIETLGGDHINAVIGRAIAMAFTAGQPVRFKFNDVTVTVDGNCAPALVYRDWERAMAGCLGKEVGPTYATQLTEDELASDAKVHAENKARQDASRAEYESKQAAKRTASDAEIAGHDMTMAGAEGIEKWAASEAANKDDGYGMAVINYAQRWARMMEARMAAGATLAECHKQASYDADVEGITGFQHGCAVSMLSECWVHGPELRKLERRGRS